MDFNHIFIEFCGLQDVKVDRVIFCTEDLSAKIYAHLPKELARCCRCKKILLSVHQWQQRTFRVPQLGIYKTIYVDLIYPRGACGECFAITTAANDFVHYKFDQLSAGFVELAGRLMEETTCEAAGRLMNYDSKAIWNLDQWRMDRMKELVKTPEDLDVSYMSADEVHFRSLENKERDNPFSEMWIIKYITNLVCSKHSKIIANASGRDSAALSKCLNVLSKEKREEILFFALDMNQGFFASVEKLCPNAEIAVDRFHLVQSLNDAFNELRKDEWREAKKRGDEFQEGMLEAGRRFILTQRNPNLSIEESNMLGKLKMLNVNINSAMLIVDYFHRVLDRSSVAKFRDSLKRWYRLVRESKLKIFRKFALQVSKYRLNIEAYIKSNLTTAISEGLNNKIKVLKRMGYGYTNETSFKNKILQRCGFLNSKFINTNPWLWHAT